MAPGRLDSLRHRAIAGKCRGARDGFQLSGRVELGLQLDDHFGGRALADATRAANRCGILAHDRTLEHLEACRAEDVEPDFGADPIDLYEHLEQVELLDRREAVEVQLGLADVGVDVEVDVAAGRGNLLARRRAHADHVADAADVEHYEIRPRTSNLSAEVGDHLTAARVNCRLRAWHTAMAMASRA